MRSIGFQKLYSSDLVTNTEIEYRLIHPLKHRKRKVWQGSAAMVARFNCNCYFAVVRPDYTYRHIATVSLNLVINNWSRSCSQKTHFIDEHHKDDLFVDPSSSELAKVSYSAARLNAMLVAACFCEQEHSAFKESPPGKLKVSVWSWVLY